MTAAKMRSRTSSTEPDVHDFQRRSRVRHLFCCALLAAAELTGISTTARAQTSDAHGPHTFFTPKDGAVAAGFFALSAGVSFFDVDIEHFFLDTTRTHVRIGRKLDNVFTHVNETTLTVGGLAVYGIARLARARTVADVAFHVSESVAAASITSQVIRGPLGRTRPRNSTPPYDDQYEFHAFQGFRHFENRAFPSIHSSSGFAAASVLVAEVHRRSPAATLPVAIPAYALALTPGLSRMYLGQHWASDIVAGAFLGTFFGWRVVEYAHDHPTTPVDRVFLGKVRHTTTTPFRFGWTISF